MCIRDRCACGVFFVSSPGGGYSPGVVSTKKNFILPPFPSCPRGGAYLKKSVIRPPGARLRKLRYSEISRTFRGRARQKNMSVSQPALSTSLPTYHAKLRCTSEQKCPTHHPHRNANRPEARGHSESSSEHHGCSLWCSGCSCRVWCVCSRWGRSSHTKNQRTMRGSHQRCAIFILP